jgi:hypothetical protein
MVLPLRDSGCGWYTTTFPPLFKGISFGQFSCPNKESGRAINPANKAVILNNLIIPELVR